MAVKVCFEQHARRPSAPAGVSDWLDGQAKAGRRG
jgi:hypothetical protein